MYTWSYLLGSDLADTLMPGADTGIMEGLVGVEFKLFGGDFTGSLGNVRIGQSDSKTGGWCFEIITL